MVYFDSMKEFKFTIKPDEHDVEAAEVLVEGKVASKNYIFLLDTGAARTSVQYDDFTSKFKSLKKESSSSVFTRSSEDLIMVSHIELGPILKKDLLIVRYPPKQRSARNLIGMDILKDYSLKFLFDENKVLVDPPESGESVISQDLFLDKRNHPYIDINFKQLTVKAVWDTGAGITVVDINFINQFPSFFQEMDKSIGTDASGIKMETPMYTMKSIKIGNHMFPSLKVAGVDLSIINSTIDVPMNLILGYNMLNKANWIFDFPRRKWAILDLLVYDF